MQTFEETKARDYKTLETNGRTTFLYILQAWVSAMQTGAQHHWERYALAKRTGEQSREEECTGEKNGAKKLFYQAYNQKHQERATKDLICRHFCQDIFQTVIGMIWDFNMQCNKTKLMPIASN